MRTASSSGGHRIVFLVVLASVLWVPLACPSEKRDSSGDFASMLVPGLAAGLTKAECKGIGGDVDDLGDGTWTCCSGSICMNCEGDVDCGAGDVSGCNCYCTGTGCPNLLEMVPGLRTEGELRDVRDR